MLRNEAEKILNETFNQSFDADKFSNFIKNLFNEINIYQRDSSRYIAKEYKDYISEFIKLGDYKDSSKEEIEVLAVKLMKTSSRDRARTMQRNFVAKWLGNTGKKAALVAFYGEDPQDWRFSFVKMEYNLIEDEVGKVKILKEVTPARRYSYLVGINEPNHTCKTQFIELLMEDKINPTLEDIFHAFSIEKVTKTFFSEYKELYLKLNESLEKIKENDIYVRNEFENKNISTVDFSKKLLGQIVFIYFLQKKGWLGVRKDDKGVYKEWGSGPKNFLRILFDKKIINYKSYFNEILEPLFYEALSIDRSANNDYYGIFKCKIPFLNGGLFEPLNDYDWDGVKIDLDNSIFKNILDTFDRYNFTVKEDEPLEKEVAVDPEMLGKVFENLLEIKDRKSQGAYYTPREIVHFMCQQSLINYLYSKTSISKEDIKNFVVLGDFALDQTIKSQEQKKKYKGKSYISQKYILPKSIEDNYIEVDELLREIKIVDPAVGSGAFPIGMMNEIVKARSILSLFFEQDRNVYDLKREAIENSLYGVDIDPSAVDIAKLRFWLSMIVDEADIKNIKPLPNLDHKIMCGNSLLEEFEGINLFDESLLTYTEDDFAYEKAIIDEKIQKLYFEKGRIALGKEKNKTIKEVEKEIKELKNKRKKLCSTDKSKDVITTLDEPQKIKVKSSHEKLSELKRLQKKYFNGQDRTRKKSIWGDIEKLEWELIEITLKENNKEETLEDILIFKKKKSKPFFLWKLYFSEIFQRDNPGFDIVIANPPYIQLQNKHGELADLYEPVGYSSFARTGDIYCLFYEQGYRLLNKDGHLCYISSNKWMRANYGEKLRSFLVKNTNPKLIIDLGPNIFEMATVDTNILLFQKSAYSHETIGCAVKEDFNVHNPIERYVEEHGILMSDLSKDSWIILSREEQDIKEKIEKIGKPIKKWDNIQINYGIKTGYNEAFIIDRKKKDELISIDPKNAEIIKPLLRGKDIKRYKASFKDLWIIAILPSLKLKIDDYPIIKKYLMQFGKKLEQIGETYIDSQGIEQKTRKKTSNKWYETQDQVNYYKEFEKEKIIYPDIATKLSFYLDNNYYYLNNTCYFMNFGNDNIYVLPILNSKLINWYFKQISAQLGSKGLRHFNIYIEKIPIPDVEYKYKLPIITNVKNLLKLLKTEDVNKQKEIKIIENNIDNLIYTLYGLTDEEIKIIEGFDK